MKKAMLVALLSAAAITAADAKVRVAPKGPPVCSLNGDTVAGIPAAICKDLIDQADGKIVRGCWFLGKHFPQFSEDQCDLAGGVWDWIRL